MFSSFSLRSLLVAPTAATTAMRSTTTTMASMTTRLFSTSAPSLARVPPKGAKGGKAAVKPGKGTTPVRKSQRAGKSENFERIKLLKRNMFSPAPPPLRMARLRHLRHWTIHRAWQLFRRQQRDAIALERQRLNRSMYNACEELRKTRGPGSRDEGYLYRVAMEKKGVFGIDDVPIEYTRIQTEYPPKEAWNHDWKR